MSVQSALMSGQRGRPKKANTKAGILQIRIEEDLKTAVKDAALRDGLDLSAWVRQRLFAASKTAAVEPPATVHEYERPIRMDRAHRSVGSASDSYIAPVTPLEPSGLEKSDGRPLSAVRHERVTHSGRVRIPPEVSRVVGWIDHRSVNSPMECLAAPGPSGERRVVPPKNRLWELRRNSLARPNSIPTRSADVAELSMRLHRYFAESFRLSLSTDPDGYAVLQAWDRPEVFCPGDDVVFFATDEVLELWEPRQWLNYIANVAAELNERGPVWLETLSGNNPNSASDHADSTSANWRASTAKS